MLLFRLLTHLIHFPTAFERVKPVTLHFMLLFLILLYSFVGGMVFQYLEQDAIEQNKQLDAARKFECIQQVFTNASSIKFVRYVPSNETLDEITRCFDGEIDERSQWSMLTAAFYGFGIATTLGYNRLAPVTISGRMFCIIYGICGIPITMIIIANVGQYIHQFASLVKKNAEVYNKRRRASKQHITENDIPDSSIEFTSVVLLFAFLLYVTFGALFLPLLNGEFDFFNGLYYNFICLTAIDFGHIVPKRIAFWPITFLYICVGLAITTIAIDVGSQYMKKLHHLGQKMKNVAHTKIWFGGKTLKVRDLLHAVGKKCGVDPHVIDNLDLENVVERTIALNEGKTLPPDLNEEEPPKEPQPAMTPSNDRPEFLAIDVSEPDEEPPIDYHVTPFMMSHTMQTIMQDDYASSSQLNLNDPVIILDDADLIKCEANRIDEPKKFREKREKYGRDPKKLYATYQEEWNRLERLSTTLLGGGGRRRSVISSTAASPAHSPIRISIPNDYTHDDGNHSPDNNNSRL